MTVDDYPAALPEPQRGALEHLRRLITALVPSVEERIRVGVPPFRYRGRPLVSIGAAKQHLSRYVMYSQVLPTLTARLDGLDWSATVVRFTPDDPLAEELARRDRSGVTYDRRGRGSSGEDGPASVDREIEDLAALVDELGEAPAMYGHSSGAALALRAVATGVSVTHLVLHEAPFNLDEPDARRVSQEYRRQLDRLLEEGRHEGAVELFMRTVGAPAEVIGGMRSEPWWPGLVALGRSLVHDSEAMGDRHGATVPSELLSRVAAPTLVLCAMRARRGCSRSPTSWWQVSRTRRSRCSWVRSTSYQPRSSLPSWTASWASTPRARPPADGRRSWVGARRRSPRRGEEAREGSPRGIGVAAVTGRDPVVQALEGGELGRERDLAVGLEEVDLAGKGDGVGARARTRPRASLGPCTGVATPEAGRTTGWALLAEEFFQLGAGVGHHQMACPLQRGAGMAGVHCLVVRVRAQRAAAGEVDALPVGERLHVHV
jgi:uncharacterized protein YdhG (YjbR/CyaY superfamily)